MKTSASIAIVVGVLILLAIGFYLYSNPRVEQTQDQASQSTVQTDSFGTLPDVVPVDNPTGELTDVNPAAQANPFSGSYRNPFSQ